MGVRLFIFYFCVILCNSVADQVLYLGAGFLSGHNVTEHAGEELSSGLGLLQRVPPLFHFSPQL